MNAPTILDESQVQPVATILADAMSDDPAYAYLMPEPASRPVGLRDYFARSLQTYLPHRCTYVAVDGRAALATVTVRPPSGIHVSIWTMIRQGLLPFAFARGLGAVRRLFALKDAYDRIEVNLSGGRSHWYVHMMAVDRAQQGAGKGSALLAEVLSKTADAHGNERHPVVLTTHKERNVVFYRRAGFEVTDVRRLAFDGATAYSVWGMRRV